MFLEPILLLGFQRQQSRCMIVVKSDRLLELRRTDRRVDLGRVDPRMTRSSSC